MRPSAIAEGAAAPSETAGGPETKRPAGSEEKGDPPDLTRTQYAPNIQIDGSQSFQAAARGMLADVARTPAGRQALEGISGSGRTMTIAETRDPTLGSSVSSPSEPGLYSRGPKGEPGLGADTLLSLNPQDRSAAGVAHLTGELGRAQQIMTGTAPAMERPIRSQYSPHIAIEGDKNFQAGVKSLLDKVGSTRMGQGLLQGIETSGRQLTIRPGDNQAAGDSPHQTMNQPRDGRPGVATDSSIGLNPFERRVIDPKDPGAPQNVPNDAVLAHELVHAYNMMHGTTMPGTDKATGTPNEELATVGLIKNPAHDFSENAYLAELGLPPRDRYR